MVWDHLDDLSTEKISLRPMSEHDQASIVAAASDGKLWDLWFTSVPSANTVEDYLEEALAQKKQGSGLPLVVVDNQTGQVIGSTRFCNYVEQHRRVEIGYTFYAKSYQRSSVNTECKWLMLSYAFETMNVVAVEFRTHWLNHASRTAIERLGAKQDGVLRKHRILDDGSYRDTVVFSILDNEWTMVKRHLQHKLAATY
ncbi:MAG: GNAT family protein [Kangiellaceae bacterium]|jgi:RimJ/RimL family protein N-acetyltransferase|nr:GNAT family protein [Kangiellaceae bacterium]